MSTVESVYVVYAHLDFVRPHAPSLAMPNAEPGVPTTKLRRSFRLFLKYFSKDTPSLDADERGYSPSIPPTSAGAASTSTLPSINISSPLAQNATLEQRKPYVPINWTLQRAYSVATQEKEG